MNTPMQTKIDGSHSTMRRTSLGLGIALIVSGWLATKLQCIPKVGIVVSPLAPDLVLLGFVMIAMAIAWTCTNRLSARLLITVGLALLFGLNTRIPSVVDDALARWNQVRFQPGTRLPATEAQPIHIDSNVVNLSARDVTYDSVQPSCDQRGCFFLDGFQTPGHGSYWHENVESALHDAGFVKAEPGQRAPLIAVMQTASNDFISIRIELKDIDGKSVAAYTGRFRKGFPWETLDSMSRAGVHSERMRFEYLMHGNFLNQRIGDMVAPATSHPMRDFLNLVRHPR